MDPIKKIVSGLMERMSSSPGGSMENLQGAWERVSKDRHSKVIDFKDGSMTISAASSMRLVKLNLNRESLLKDLQKEFPGIVKLNFKVRV